MESNYFTYIIEGNNVSLRFEKKSFLKTFMRMYFYSRLLHSLKPDVSLSDKQWKEKERLNAEIIGWPKNVLCQYDGDLNIKCRTTEGFDIEGYLVILDTALENFLEGEEDELNSSQHIFKIRHNDEVRTYKFYTTSRAICALCILYDLETHPRNDLEVNINSNLQTVKEIQDNNASKIMRVYGDPSKIADELRNEGWPRTGENPLMVAELQMFHGGSQQVYRLNTRDQDRDLQVKRTSIKAQWQRTLFETNRFTCKVCGNSYSHTESYLNPDHRVPVIVQADMLTDENYMDKLMTLCRFCNQQKRETCKQCPYEQNCSECHWAWPEKFELRKIKEEITRLSKKTNQEFGDIISKLQEES